VAAEYRFKNSREALSFMHRAGEVAEAEGHHPDTPSAGATPLSRCRPRRSKVCTRTTSSWRRSSTVCRRPSAGLASARAWTCGSCDRLQAAEAHREELPARDPAPIVLFQQSERLRLLATQRQRHPAARPELRDQRRGRHVSSGRRQDQGCVLRPSARAVAHADLNVATPEPDQTRALRAATVWEARPPPNQPGARPHWVHYSRCTVTSAPPRSPANTSPGRATPSRSIAWPQPPALSHSHTRSGCGSFQVSLTEQGLCPQFSGKGRGCSWGSRSGRDRNWRGRTRT
jgi:hypothetical protein